MAEEVVIIIDMQNAFIEEMSPFCIRYAKSTIPACAGVLNKARTRGIPVIFVNRRYRANGFDVELPRRALWARRGKPLSEEASGTLSGDNPPALGPKPGDLVLIKPRFSAFFQTELDLLLRRMGAKKLYLLGTTTPNCIRTTCYDGIALDYDVTVIEDCCSSDAMEIQRSNLADMARIGAKIIHAADF